MAGPYFDAGAVVAALTAVGPQARQAGVLALGDAAEYLLSQAVPITPIEEGPLSQSGRTAVDEGSLTSAVGFGSGPSVKYARRQHEDPTFHHDAGRQWHYLSDPLHGMADTFLRLLGRRIGDTLGGGR